MPWTGSSGGTVDAFCDFVGTGGTFAGVSPFLKEQRSPIACYVVEPAGAAVLAGEAVPDASHRIPRRRARGGRPATRECRSRRRLTHRGRITKRWPALWGGLSFQGFQEVAAGLLAASAGLGADPAVRHVGMPFALLAAAVADGDARLQQRPGDAGVVFG
jgi:hypothetical protein